ncbi:MAG: glycerophosphodiester phosphodiesterase family protein, partial [Christensenellales bacterium]
MDLFQTWLVEKYIAHRGLHNNNIAENSISAFKNAVENNYAIELDVHQISDGTLVVFHDETLSRMTGKDGYLQSLTKKDLKNYKLAG